MSRAPHWTIADVLDFEWLLARDRATSEDALQARDHALRQKIGVPEPESTRDRPSLFHAWLEARRETDAVSFPGAYFLSGWQTLVTVAALIGLLLGGSVTVGLLHYRSEEPVNVSWFLALTVGLQMLVLLAAVLVWLLHHTTHWFDEFRPLRAVLTALAWALSTSLRRLPGPERDHIRAALATLRHKREIYGSLATWPFFVVTQVFAVACNLGILATLGTHLAFTNLHFQWESTLVRSPGGAHAIVSTVALPWSWLAPAAALSRAEIEASHNIDRARFREMLASHDPALRSLTAWWPFLCASVLFYGLFVRGALLVFAAAKWRQALCALRFDHAEANALWRRLREPLITTAPEAARDEAAQVADPAIKRPGAGTCLALIAQELPLDEENLRRHLRQKLGWDLTKTWPVQIDNRHECSGALRELRDSAESKAGVVVVIPIERDPIVAIALFLKDVIAACGNESEVLLLLPGPPELDGRLEFWRRFNAIHGLHLGLERWTS